MMFSRLTVVALLLQPTVAGVLVRLTAAQQRRVRELVTDEGQTRAEAIAYVIAFEPEHAEPAPVAAVEAGKKVCTNCKETKALAYFHRRRNAKDGRNTICASCKRVIQRDSLRRTRGRSVSEIQYPELEQGSTWSFEVNGARRTTSVVRLRWHTRGTMAVLANGEQVIASWLRVHGKRVDAQGAIGGAE